MFIGICGKTEIKMNLKKKRICSFLTTILLLLTCVFSAVGCGSQSGGSNESNGSDSSQPSYEFQTIFTDNTENTSAKYNPASPEENGEISYDIVKSVGEKNFMRIRLDTDVNLIGYVHYTNAEDSDVNNAEKFYIEAGSTEFTTFLDAYRKGAFAAYKKVIQKITLKNVDSTKAGKITLKSVDFSDRSYDPNQMMYIDDGMLRVGTSPGLGGALTYVARIGSNVKEYVNADGDTIIGRIADTSSVDLISETVNLVNTYDLGREIQQSFYWPVKEQHGYIPTSEKKYPGDLNYNPIQCGSAGSVGPQIVDYYCTKDEIYVKAYGQDWYLVNQVDATYYENWFKFGDDGVLIVKNKITNFTQFTETSGLEFVCQESPAFYSVYPLNYFYAETVQGTIFDNSLCPYGTGIGKTSLNQNVTDRYYYSLAAGQIPDSWIAYVTEKKFGLGIYNPSAHSFKASRGYTSIKYADKNNHTTHKDFYDDDYSSYVPSCYANNYGYLNTGIICQMVDFVPLEYSYAIFAGDVTEMRSAFKKLKSSGELVAANLSWPTREEA